MSERGNAPRLIVIFIAVAMNSIGFGIVMPVLPQLLTELTGDGLADAARYGGYLLFVYAVMQFLFSPVIGNLSDRFGRRPVLLISLFSLSIDYLIMALAPTLGWLVVGRVLAGVAGATFSTANAYVADISTPEERPQNFGLLGAAFGVGFIIGPVLGGFLGEFGSRVPFFGAAALCLAAGAYGYFVVPESLAVKSRRPFDFARANPVGALRQLQRHPVVFSLAGAYFLYQVGHHVLPSTWSFYAIERYDWTSREVGYSLGFVGVLMAIVQGYLTRIAIPRLGVVRTAHVSFLLCTLAFVGYAFAASPWMAYAAMVPGALSALLSPSLNGMMSSQVPANAQGELQGALASLMGIASIVSPLAMTQVFGFFTAPGAPIYFPGAAFVLAAALTLASFALVLRVTRLSTAFAPGA